MHYEILFLRNIFITNMLSGKIELVIDCFYHSANYTEEGRNDLHPFSTIKILLAGI